MIRNRIWVFCLLDYYKTNARCFLKFDKLIVDDNAYIYNDMEGRVEKLPHKVGLWLMNVIGECDDDGYMSIAPKE